MSEFKWWVPVWFRNWVMLHKRKKAAQVRLYTCSPTGWLISQHKGRKEAWRGYTPIYNREITEGHVVIEGRPGWSQYGFDTGVYQSVRLGVDTSTFIDYNTFVGKSTVHRKDTA